MAPVQRVEAAAGIATCAGQPTPSLVTNTSSLQPLNDSVPTGFHLVGDVLVEDDINEPRDQIESSSHTSDANSTTKLAVCTECIICARPVREVWVTPCGHGPFDIPCLETWYRTCGKNRTTRCPLCREVMRCPPIKLFFLHDLCEYNLELAAETDDSVPVEDDLTWMNRVQWGEYRANPSRERPARMSTGGRPPRPQVPQLVGGRLG